jgi:colanic acid biosynthesis glycosyl transferase WcaI
MRILILNQAFYPDVVSTAQHASDLALGLMAAGNEVVVVASSRGYDDRTRRFPARETWHGIEIHRVEPTTFGKASRWRRAVDFASFLLKCGMRVATLRRCDVLVAMTSPPLISFLGALAVPLKAKKLICWTMDLNPDEAIAAGWLSPHSRTARMLDHLLGYSFNRADKIVALDRFMRSRIHLKDIKEGKIAVVPPWAHDDHVTFDRAGREQFRRKHKIDDKFVVMYSGNHSPCHSLQTLLDVADELRGEPEIVFCFVGGGSEFEKLKQQTEQRKRENVRWIPYQPIEKLSASLSAADLHAVVMGDAFPGIVHPCKIYNILATQAPFLYIGPAESHIVDIIRRIGDPSRTFRAQHGEVALARGHVLSSFISRYSVRHPYPISRRFSRATLVPKMIEEIAGALAGVPSSAAGPASFDHAAIREQTQRSNAI